ncbi:MAG: MBL fold metallo-hydrolase [Faecalibacterium sp.]
MENFKKEKVSLWRRIAALALAAALALGLAACDASAVVPGSSTPAVSTAQPAGDGQTANFEMHFLDVGQALSVLVECDGQYMLYDGGNVDDGSYVVSYLQNLGVEELQYVFCSHAHEDHVGGPVRCAGLFPGRPCVQPRDGSLHQVLSGLRQVHPAAGPAGGSARCGHSLAAGQCHCDHAGPCGAV